MVKTVKSIKPFEEDCEQLLKDAHQRTGCIVNVLAIHPITGERHEVIVDSTNDGDVSTLAEDHFTVCVVRRYLRLKGRLGEVTLRMLSEELVGAMRLADVKKGSQTCCAEAVQGSEDVHRAGAAARVGSPRLFLPCSSSPGDNT
ncbi:hypothetical protein OsI_18671 [Oryza sativa Indica Group]|jgi:hypothetical protein|uniref:Uncharacterized protein n=1 Tax=Oryza sativa subsp. indica TaxID=39946 RepID=B8AYN1_ORYSI|nr:hypothetical protein OsI_18671 [Oryza sativa Indica Group]